MGNMKELQIKLFEKQPCVCKGSVIVRGVDIDPLNVVIGCGVCWEKWTDDSFSEDDVMYLASQINVKVDRYDKSNDVKKDKNKESILGKEREKEYDDIAERILSADGQGLKISLLGMLKSLRESEIQQMRYGTGGLPPDVLKNALVSFKKMIDSAYIAKEEIEKIYERFEKYNKEKE